MAHSCNMRVAIIQPALAHYREPIYRALSNRLAGDLKYTIFAGTNSKDGVRVLPFQQAGGSADAGGLNWRRIHNCWLGRILLWQSASLSVAISREFDAIIFAGSMYHISTWVALALARLTGKRTLLWTHGVLRRERGPKGMVRRIFYRMADGLLLYGHRAKGLLAEHGFPPETLYVVYNSLDYETQCRLREGVRQDALELLKSSLFQHPEHPIVVFIGRLTPQKKIHLLIQAATILSAKRFPVNVLLVGDGPERATLEALAHRNGLQQYVKFFGEVYDEEQICPLISLASACVAPGEVGLTCMHSLVYGTPVITHGNPDAQVPEWEAIEPGRTGAFFLENDAQDLADVLQRSIVAWTDRGVMREHCARVIDEHYNPAKQCEAFEAAVRGRPA